MGFVVSRLYLPKHPIERLIERTIENPEWIKYIKDLKSDEDFLSGFLDLLFDEKQLLLKRRGRICATEINFYGLNFRVICSRESPYEVYIRTVLSPLENLDMLKWLYPIRLDLLEWKFPVGVVPSKPNGEIDSNTSLIEINFNDYIGHLKNYSENNPEKVRLDMKTFYEIRIGKRRKRFHMSKRFNRYYARKLA